MQTIGQVDGISGNVDMNLYYGGDTPIPPDPPNPPFDGGSSWKKWAFARSFKLNIRC